MVECRPLMREVESSNPDDGYTHFRAGAYKPVNCSLTTSLRPVVNRQVGSHPTVMLDIGMPYPPLEQDSAGGALKDRSPCEVASQCRCLPNQERVAE